MSVGLQFIFHVPLQFRAGTQRIMKGVGRNGSKSEAERVRDDTGTGC